MFVTVRKAPLVQDQKFLRLWGLDFSAPTRWDWVDRVDDATIFATEAQALDWIRGSRYVDGVLIATGPARERHFDYEVRPAEIHIRFVPEPATETDAA